MPGNGHKGNGHGKPEIVATYDYCDEDGDLLYQAVRFMPKDFMQRRPDGKGGWIWNMQNVRRILYRLPELREHPDLPVWIPEGEKDVEALRVEDSLRPATSWGLASGGPSTAKTCGRVVCVLPDNDEPGRKHARQVAEALQGVAESVRIVQLPTTRGGQP